MRRYPTFIAVGIATALTVASGLVHGRLADRWRPKAMLDAGARLQGIPEQFGKWRLKSSRSLDEDTGRMLESTGDVVRSYKNEETGEEVQVTVIVGPWGPISVHTPDVCFSSRDFKRVEVRKRATVVDSTGAKSDFWAETFLTNGLEARNVRAYWAWSRGDSWLAPDGVKSTFIGSPHLYKIQLTSYLPAVLAPQAEDPVFRFLKDFVPAAAGSLIAADRK
jgi:hypothetical protein